MRNQLHRTARCPEQVPPWHGAASRLQYAFAGPGWGRRSGASACATGGGGPLEGTVGYVHAPLELDGTPILAEPGQAPQAWRTGLPSRRLPLLMVYLVPHWWAVAALATPPPLWAAVRL